MESLVDQICCPSTPDHQISALLMAIYLNGMDLDETTYLTQAMANSGEQIDLRSISGEHVDKHSTGGVGDKISLILIPMIASIGVPILKLSGKGLGHTGGTLDKLGTFSGIKLQESVPSMIQQVREIGLGIFGQTSTLVPADKIMYDLRDQTATVSSLPLIAASIMSKKIAAGAKKVLLDVKVGNGANLQGMSQNHELAAMMVEIGRRLGVNTRAVLTDMESPLGHAIGNALEVREAIEVLSGQGSQRLRQLCIELGLHMLGMAGLTEHPDELRQKLESSLDCKIALRKLRQMVVYQGGNPEIIDAGGRFQGAPHHLVLTAQSSGFVGDIRAKILGMASMIAGAGRSHKDNQVDLLAGIYIHSEVGDRVSKGDPLISLYAERKELLDKAAIGLLNAVRIDPRPPSPRSLIYDCIML